MTATTTDRSPARVKPPVIRTFRWLVRPSEAAATGTLACVRITQGKDVQCYRVERMKCHPSCGQAALRFTKGDGSVYDTVLDAWGEWQCDCPGGCYKSKCKHAGVSPLLLKEMEPLA